MVCSAAEMMLLCGALTTITPRRGGGVDVDVVEPDPGPTDDHQLVGRGEHLVGDLRGRADDQGVHAIGSRASSCSGVSSSATSTV